MTLTRAVSPKWADPGTSVLLWLLLLSPGLVCSGGMQGTGKIVTREHRRCFQGEFLQIERDRMLVHGKQGRECCFVRCKKWHVGFLKEIQEREILGDRKVSRKSYHWTAEKSES